MTSALRYALIFLAAGKSVRFGDQDKLEALLDGKPLALVTASRLTDFPWVQQIAVVQSALISPPLRQMGFTLMKPVHPDTGMGDNLSLAMSAIKDADAVLIALADMPFVDSALMGRLLAAIDPERGISIAVSETDGIIAPPTVFSRKHFDALRSLSGDRGAVKLIHRFRTEAVLIPASPLKRLDIDTRDALEAANSLISPRTEPGQLFNNQEQGDDIS